MNITPDVMMIDFHPLDIQTNAMFVDRRAGASEYLLFKRGFDTYTRITHAKSLLAMKVFSL